jgi:hypothetical protein
MLDFYVVSVEALSNVKRMIFRAMCADYIASGPLLPLCGIDKEGVHGDIHEWLKQGDFLIDCLQFPPKEQLDAVQRQAHSLLAHPPSNKSCFIKYSARLAGNICTRRNDIVLLCRMRIYQYYLPVYFWCRQQLELHRQEKGASQPLILGMQAPQVPTTPSPPLPFVPAFEPCPVMHSPAYPRRTCCSSRISLTWGMHATAFGGLRLQLFREAAGSSLHAAALLQGCYRGVCAIAALARSRGMKAHALADAGLRQDDAGGAAGGAICT